MEVFLFGIFRFHFFPLAVCIAQLNMHGVSLQMRQNSWESKFWEIHENQNKFALALCIFDHSLYKIHKISGKEDFLQRVVKNLNPSLKFWGKGRISDDASRMGKVLMVANLGSQQGLTWKVWASDQFYFWNIFQSLLVLFVWDPFCNFAHFKGSVFQFQQLQTLMHCKACKIFTKLNLICLTLIWIFSDSKIGDDQTDLDCEQDWISWCVL